MKKQHDQNRKRWIQFLEKRIAVMVVKGASKAKIEALKGNLKRLKNVEKKYNKKDT